MMMTGSISAQILSRKARIRAPGAAFFGRSNCSRRTRMNHVTHSATAIIRPGKIPARNSLVIETPPTTPNRMKPMDGGMIGAMIEAEAISPAARPGSCPALRIIGNSNAPSAAASATAEPERLAITQAAKIATKPRPPRTWPTMTSARLTMRRERPPAFMISPASRKNGTAISGKLSAPFSTFCATI